MADVETLPTTMAEADKALADGGEAPETPAQPDAPAAQPEPQVEGQPRDDQGRFAPKAPEAPAAPAEPSPETPPAEPSTETAPAFRYNADQQEIEVPGSLEGEDGIFIPTAEVPRIKQLLAEGHAWSGSAQRYINENNRVRQSLEQRASAAEQQTQAVEAQLSQVLGHFEQLVEQSAQFPPEKMFESPLGQWLLDVRGGWGVLKAEARAARIEKEREADRKQLETYQTQQREAELRPQMDLTLSDAILHFGGQMQLDRPTMEGLYTTLRSPQYESFVFVRAPQDDPLNGIKKGELVINYGVVQQEVERVSKLLAPYKNGQPKAQEPKPAQPVKKPTPPPTVSATRGPTPRKAIPEPKTRADADRMLEEGGYDLD